MAVVTNPLMFGKARGSLARTITYQMWRGLQIVRSKPKSRNAGTPAQLNQQSLFKAAVTFANRYLFQSQDSIAWRRYVTYQQPAMDYRNAAIRSSFRSAKNQPTANMYAGMIRTAESMIELFSYRATDGETIDQTILPAAYCGARADQLDRRIQVLRGLSGHIFLDLAQAYYPTSYVQVALDNVRSGIYQIDDLPTPPPPPPPPPPGPPTDYVAYWEFADAGSGTVIDQTGVNNGNESYGYPVTGLKGVPTSAYYFDGQNTMIDVHNNAVLSLNAMTLSLWIKFSSSSFMSFICKFDHAAGDKGFELSANNIASGKLEYNLIGNYPQNHWIIASGSDTINDGNWHLIQATYDGLGDVSGVRLYVDNILQTLTVGANTLSGVSIQNSERELFGVRPDGTRRYQGTMQFVRHYNRVLTNDKRTAIWTAEKP